MDVTQLVMALHAKTGVEIVATEQWQSITTLFFSSAADAQRVYEAMAAEEMTVSPPVEVNGEYSVSVTL